MNLGFNSPTSYGLDDIDKSSSRDALSAGGPTENLKDIDRPAGQGAHLVYSLRSLLCSRLNLHISTDCASHIFNSSVTSGHPGLGIDRKTVCRPHIRYFKGMGEIA